MELDRLRDEFVAPEQLQGLYIEPYLQDRNPADSHQEDLVSASQQLAFERINGFFRGSLPLEKDGRHQMFILSDAGMGKTSLLLMIKLMHLADFWPKGFNCSLLKLGDDTLERIYFLPDKDKTILLLDGLDEDPHAWKRIRERMLELLQASEDFRRVIISSRTQFFPEMEPDRIGRPEIKVLSGYHCPVLYLSPFYDEQVQEFIERKLPLRWYHFSFFQSGRIKKERVKAVRLLEQMQDLRMRPMLLQHIDKLLAVSERQEWNSYKIYEALIDQWLDREVRKLQNQHTLRRVPERKELFQACVRIAEKMERQRQLVISEEELQLLIRKDENISWLEKFELGGRSLLNRNSERAFRFSHYTVQTFLLSWGIVNDQLAVQKPLRITEHLLRFLEESGYLPDKLHLVDIGMAVDNFSIAVRIFASCKTLSHIALLSSSVDWISRPLVDRAGNYALDCLKLSQDVRSALKASTLYRREQRLKDVEMKIDEQRNRLDILHDNETSAFSSVLDHWQRIIEAACETLHDSAQEDFEVRQVYLAGPPLKISKAGHLFKGRRDLFLQIETLTLLAQHPTLVMHGGRRSGKTSTLNYLPKWLPSHILPLLVECQALASLTTLESFAEFFAKQIICSAREVHGLRLPSPDSGRLVRDPFAALFDWIDDVEDVVSNKTLLICLDEFERLDEIVRSTDSRAPLNFLRHLIQHRDRWTLLFTGVQTPEELPAYWSDYLINCETLRVSYLAEADCLELIQHPVEDFPDIYPDAVAYAIRDLTGGQPYFTQLLCHELVEQLNRNKAKRVEIDDLETVLSIVFERGYQVFREFWESLTQEQRDFLLAVAEEKTPDEKTLQAAPVLMRKEILAQEKSGWSFRVPLIQQWIIRNG